MAIFNDLDKMFSYRNVNSDILSMESLTGCFYLGQSFHVFLIADIFSWLFQLRTAKLSRNLSLYKTISVVKEPTNDPQW